MPTAGLANTENEQLLLLVLAPKSKIDSDAHAFLPREEQLLNEPQRTRLKRQVISATSKKECTQFKSSFLFALLKLA